MEEYIDVTGVPLKPGDMRNCAGNGKFYDIDGNKIECCCDNCNFFIECILKTNLPEFQDEKQFLLSVGYYIDENGICKCKEDKFLWRR